MPTTPPPPLSLTFTLSRQTRMLVQRVAQVPGEGYLIRFYTGSLGPVVQPLTLLYSIDRKEIPIVYLPFPNGTPYTYLV